MNSINCIVCVFEFGMGVGVWFGTPNMQRMYGLSLAWHFDINKMNKHIVVHTIGKTCNHMIYGVFVHSTQLICS